MEKKIKIIDLLNKIANGEEVPKKIKYKGTIYCLCENDDFKDYIDKGQTYGLFESIATYCLVEYLTNEVEILDEEDEFEDIEHYDMFDYFGGYDFGGTNKELLGNLQTNFEHINNELDNLIKNQKKIISKLGDNND